MAFKHCPVELRRLKTRGMQRNLKSGDTWQNPRRRIASLQRADKHIRHLPKSFDLVGPNIEQPVSCKENLFPVLGSNRQLSNTTKAFQKCDTMGSPIFRFCVSGQIPNVKILRMLRSDWRIVSSELVEYRVGRQRRDQNPWYCLIEVVNLLLLLLEKVEVRFRNEIRRISSVGLVDT